MHSDASKKRDRVQPSRLAGASALSVILLLGQTAPLLANPTGGVVVAGAATIGAAGKTLTINQSTNAAIINWQTFSIASGETTKFVVPSSTSATLNYVLGGNPSAIYGTLSSNGQLYLVNPSGILVGSGGRIDTAGFLGSTLNANNNEFLAGGNLHFTGNSTAGIDNQGTISASSGNVYLIASQVSNEGTIKAPQGNVGLAAGSNVLLQQSGDQHLFVQSNPIGTTRAVGVSNAGTIQAASAELRAAGGNAYALAINNTGSIAATGYKKINGQVYLTADTGAIANSGSIKATTSAAKGGTVSVTSQTGTITNSGTIDTSATARGGQGGTVLLKSTQGAVANTGAINARGGTAGTGGTVELSGATVSAAKGVVDTLAVGGKTGMFILDPVMLTIAPTGGDETGAQVATQLATSNVQLNADTTITINDGITWTSANTLTLSTNSTGSTIAINQPISGVNGGLVLNTAGANDFINPGANGAINVSRFILESGFWNQESATLAGFVASHDFEIQNASTFWRVTGGDGSGANPYQIVDIYGLEGLGSPSKDFLLACAVLENDLDASGTANWNGGAGWVPIGSYDGSNSSDANTYSGFFNGQGHTISGLTINAPQSSFAGLFGDTATGSTVENLNLTNVSVTGNVYVGALTGVSNATVTNCTSSGTVTGTDFVGGLVGISGGPISNSSTSGTVNGNASGVSIGGLVGEAQFGSITNSSSSANVLTGAANNTYNVGGLVGFNLVSISGSSSTGTVTGQIYTGGLVGLNEGSISGSNSSSHVTGGSQIGGLVGDNTASISTSYSTGTVSGSSSIGGLVGENSSGTITTSYSTSPVSGLNEVGGLVGTNIALVSNSYSSGAVSGTSDMIGGLIGYNLTGTVVDSYTSSTVTPGGNATEYGGLVGYDTTGTYTNVFWDTTTAGVGSGVGAYSGNAPTGIIGATSANLMTQGFITSNSSGSPAWDFVNTWTTNGGTTLPGLINVGSGSGGGGGGGNTDTLSGTVYLNSGLTLAPNVTLEFIFDGTVIGTTTTDSSGAYSFDVSPTDIGGGLVITDAADKGNTFFQSSSQATTFSGIDLWGATLRVIADVASNSLLKTAIGSLTGHGINYAVSAGGLSTNAGVNLSIVSNYMIDGNITSAGTITAAPGSNLTGSVNATLQGTAVSLEGGLDDTGALVVHSTSGEIFLQNVGNSEVPAISGGLTLSSTGAVDIQSCYLDLTAGNFSATGTGYTSTTNANGQANGVNIFDSSITAEAGNITLTGTAGYTSAGGGILNSGLGVGIGSDGETPVSLSAFGSGNITITGTASQNITSQTFVAGVDIYQDGSAGIGINAITVEDGALTINGTVSNDTVTGTTGQGSIAGVFVGSGASVGATGAGSVAITGNATGSTAQVNGGNYQANTGVWIEGGEVGTNSGNLTVHGTAGAVNTTASTMAGNGTGVPVSLGVVVSNFGENTGGLYSGSGSTVAITGTGGAIITTGNYTGKSAGVVIDENTVSDFGAVPQSEAIAAAVPAISANTGATVTITGTGGAVNAGNGANASDARTIGVNISGILSVEDGGSLAVTGTGGALNISHAAPVTGYRIPLTQGVEVSGGGYVAGFGSTPVTLTGTGGTVTAGTNMAAGAIGVSIGDTAGSNGGATVSTENGLLTINGTGGTSPSLGAGVVIFGFNGGSASVTSSAGNIAVTGTGGAGYAGSGTITGNSIPNSGVVVADDVLVTTEGDVTLTGRGGAKSNGVTVTNLSNDTALDQSAQSPEIDGTNITLQSTSGNMLVDATLNAAGLLTISSPGTLDLENTGDTSGLSTTDLAVTATGAILINTAISGSGNDSIVSSNGDITLGPAASINVDGSESEGSAVLTIAAGTNLPHSHYIINNADAGSAVISATGGATFDLYQADSISNTLGGITVPQGNVVYGATFPNGTLPSGNGELYYVANANVVGPNGGGSTPPPPPPPSTGSTTLPNPGNGSNIVDPSIVPQNNDVQLGTGALASIWGGSVNPPFSFTGGASSPTGGNGGLAGSSGNGGQVGAGDAAQLGAGGINNVQNPAAAGALNLALGPAVHTALSAALAAFGDWSDADYHPGDNDGGGNGETLLNSGDVVVIGGNGVKSIPPGDAPKPLQQALGNNVRNGLSGH